jgi:hypothetical protein
VFGESCWVSAHWVVGFQPLINTPTTHTLSLGIDALLGLVPPRISPACDSGNLPRQPVAWVATVSEHRDPKHSQLQRLRAVYGRIRHSLWLVPFPTLLLDTAFPLLVPPPDHESADTRLVVPPRLLSQPPSPQIRNPSPLTFFSWLSPGQPLPPLSFFFVECAYRM